MPAWRLSTSMPFVASWSLRAASSRWATSGREPRTCWPPRSSRRFPGTLRPTLYGLMVFGRDPQRYGTTADLYTECAAYGGSERSGETVAAAASMRGPLGEQVVRSLDWFRDLRLPWCFATGERNDEPLLPPEVLREALVNALVHRDYAIMGRRVMLEVFRDRVEVTSPGGSLGRMTVDRVRGGGAPRSRNEAMANAMVVSGLTGRRGTGWLDMRRRMREFNGTEPELVIETGTEGPFARVTLHLDRSEKGRER